MTMQIAKRNQWHAFKVVPNVGAERQAKAGEARF